MPATSTTPMPTVMASLVPIRMCRRDSTVGIVSGGISKPCGRGAYGGVSEASGASQRRGLTRVARAFWRSLVLLRGLHRVLDRGEGGEFDVVKLAVLFLDLADIDVLNNVARLRIDRDRAARALPAHALYGNH